MPKCNDKKAECSIYELSEGKILFVPTEEMFEIHEAAKPLRVLLRAIGDDVDRGKLWQRWNEQSEPWVIGWLYHDKPKKRIHRHNSPANHPTWRFRPLETDFVPSREMFLFRSESTVAAICRAAAPDRWVDAVDVVKRLRRRFEPRYGWFAPWLLRGEDLPDDVHAVPRNEVNRARAGWHYTQHCTKGSIERYHYPKWFRDGLIPDAEILQWFYGRPMATGWYIINDANRRMREASRPESIYRAARVLWEQVRQYKRDHAAAVDLAMASAASGADERSLEKQECWTSLDPREQRGIWRLAKASTLKARCRRAGVYESQVSESLKFAGAISDVAATELRRFLDGEDRRSSGSRFGAGPIVPGLFNPSPAMLAFRNAAKRAMADNQVWSLQGKTPGFITWMLDWTLPRKMHGRRATFDQSAVTDQQKPPKRKRSGGRPKGAISRKVKERRDRVEEAWIESDRTAGAAELAKSLGLPRHTVWDDLRAIKAQN